MDDWTHILTADGKSGHAHTYFDVMYHLSRRIMVSTRKAGTPYYAVMAI